MSPGSLVGKYPAVVPLGHVEDIFVESEAAEEGRKVFVAFRRKNQRNEALGFVFFFRK